MSFYENEKNVDKYISMCGGYDGSNLHEFLSEHLKPTSWLLELGCGAGSDIDALKERYKVTGSDFSLEFLKRCSYRHPDIEFLQLNACDLQLERQFDCLFSNKVLHHLSNLDLKESLKNQLSLLNSNGLIAHSFWLGEGSEEMEGLTFNYYLKESLLAMISEFYTIVGTLDYFEFEKGDSIFIVAEKPA
ncbi:putative methyltransferase [Aliivibrio wodanis]|uniref:Putative methyltransferase n=1 Tax=Aliivibrio wodanis TaxID=80852 RepID=A0A090I719_9GAMM|nr:putative methyltransferase [Aliivibrio wodanis]